MRLEFRSQTRFRDWYAPCSCQSSQRFIGGDDMNEDTLKGQWTQVKGLIREQWGKLTNDDLDLIQGRSEQLIGKLQERYGIARDEAERQLNAWDPTTRPVR
jgi:uncharacterized protein YjbJ (UPF0337 family)